jgi:Domain of unknown function (DUF4279)
MNDPLQRASVTLLIHGDDLVPDELTSVMGRQPRTGVRKGECFKGHNGRSVTARTGMWQIGTGYREPPSIDEQITELLKSLPERSDLWHDLTARFDCYVTVGVYFANDSWTGGIILQPQTLRMLAERGLPIDFDMYAPAASN